MVWLVVWYGLVLVWCSVVLVWFGLVWCWCGLVWCWCGVVWCGGSGNPGQCYHCRHILPAYLCNISSLSHSLTLPPARAPPALRLNLNFLKHWNITIFTFSLSFLFISIYLFSCTATLEIDFLFLFFSLWNIPTHKLINFDLYFLGCFFVVYSY